MWTNFRRYFCLHHDYAIRAEPGTIFLRCRHCGHRTRGWTLDTRPEELRGIADDRGIGFDPTWPAGKLVVELFEKLISLFSNSMSYVRVGAFAVAHAGLSGAFFVLAELVDGSRGLGYWIVLVIGNIFIIGFEGLIVGIQTMRLHYYEFFSKFFTGGGAPYEPLTPVRVEEK